MPNLFIFYSITTLVFEKYLNADYLFVWQGTCLYSMMFLRIYSLFIYFVIIKDDKEKIQETSSVSLLFKRRLECFSLLFAVYSDSMCHSIVILFKITRNINCNQISQTWSQPQPQT